MKLQVILDHGDTATVERADGAFAKECAQIAREGVVIETNGTTPGMEYIPGRRVRKVVLVPEN